jgi:hypothetical protein
MSKKKASLIMHPSDLGAVGKICANCGQQISHQWFVGHRGDDLWCADCTTGYAPDFMKPNGGVPANEELASK